MKSVRYVSKEYLERCASMKQEQILQFLEDFRTFHFQTKSQSTRQISIKVPENLLQAFKAKAKIHGIPYQTQIERLMEEWTR
ncbi:MAG: CopG family antitoxin [Thermodesulfobacteriota bacterium]